MSICCLCEANRLESLIEVAAQPLSNRFLSSPDAEEYVHAKHLGVCLACGLAQMIDPVPAEELMPLYDWITYSEPEGHLDRTAEILRGLDGIGADSVIGGVSFKDDTTLARLERLGIASTWRIDPQRDLGVQRPGVGVETVQYRLPTSLDTGLAHLRESADILVSRHILEHCHDLRGYVRGLRALIRPGGYLFLEVPCCDEQFDQRDYAPLWEEHLQYFTPAIFKAVFDAFGFELVHYERVKYPMEDSLVGVGRLVGGEKPIEMRPDELHAEVDRARLYGSSFAGRKKAWQNKLHEISASGERIAVFGAGHLGCTFANLFELAPYLSFFVDDNPDKAGLFMPGSRLPIKKSQALIEEDVRLALMCFNPSVEDKVIANNAAFVERGGRFASIFPKSRIALLPTRGWQ